MTPSLKLWYLASDILYYPFSLNLFLGFQETMTSLLLSYNKYLKYGLPAHGTKYMSLPKGNLYKHDAVLARWQYSWLKFDAEDTLELRLQIYSWFKIYPGPNFSQRDTVVQMHVYFFIYENLRIWPSVESSLELSDFDSLQVSLQISNF